MDIITKNFGFLHACIIFTVVCFVCLFNASFVFSQIENQTSEINEDSGIFNWIADIVVPLGIAGITVAGANLIGPRITQAWKARANEIEQD